jgi:hypothetical protein
MVACEDARGTGSPFISFLRRKVASVGPPEILTAYRLLLNRVVHSCRGAGGRESERLRQLPDNHRTGAGLQQRDDPEIGPCSGSGIWRGRGPIGKSTAEIE